ncbi:MAG: hypothetical protein MJE12_16775 [Alphaproteobacteria bacterium]|nr:hypothetical protein [Alphaproteobacteria bacterium]
MTVAQVKGEGDKFSDDKARRRRELKTVIRIYLSLCCAGGLIISGSIFYIWSHDYFGPESKTTYCLPITQTDGTLRYDLTCAKDFGRVALTILYGPTMVVIFAGTFGLLLLGLMTAWRKLLGALRRFVGSTPVDPAIVATPKVRAVASYLLAVSCLAALGEQFHVQILFPWIAFFRGFTWPFLISPALIYVLAVAWRRRRRSAVS